MTTELAQQVEQEAQELATAPVVQPGAAVQRCHFCGQFAATGSELRGPVAVDGQQQIRWQGVCCGG